MKKEPKRKQNENLVVLKRRWNKNLNKKVSIKWEETFHFALSNLVSPFFKSICVNFSKITSNWRPNSWLFCCCCVLSKEADCHCVLWTRRQKGAPGAASFHRFLQKNWSVWTWKWFLHAEPRSPCLSPGYACEEKTKHRQTYRQPASIGANGRNSCNMTIKWEILL